MYISNSGHLFTTAFTPTVENKMLPLARVSGFGASRRLLFKLEVQMPETAPLSHVIITIPEIKSGRNQ